MKSLHSLVTRCDLTGFVFSLFQIWCISLWILKEYFQMCNYAWLFAEGFYLHSIIVLTFTNQQKLLLVSLCIGWGKSIYSYVQYQRINITNSRPLPSIYASPILWPLRYRILVWFYVKWTRTNAVLSFTVFPILPMSIYAILNASSKEPVGRVQ